MNAWTHERMAELQHGSTMQWVICKRNGIKEEKGRWRGERRVTHEITHERALGRAGRCGRTLPARRSWPPRSFRSDVCESPTVQIPCRVQSPGYQLYGHFRESFGLHFRESSMVCLTEEIQFLFKLSTTFKSLWWRDEQKVERRFSKGNDCFLKMN